MILFAIPEKKLLMYSITIKNLKQSDRALEKKNKNNDLPVYLEIWMRVYRNICIFGSYHIKYHVVSLILSTYI